MEESSKNINKNTTKVGRLQWAGPVEQIPKEDPARKAFFARPYGTSRQERPFLRRNNGVGIDGVQMWMSN